MIPFERRLKAVGRYRSRKAFSFPLRITAHVYRELVRVDLTATECEMLLSNAEVIEESWPEPMVCHELLLLTNWVRPLHVAVVVDHWARVDTEIRDARTG